jgi:hypothetical protein
MAILLQRRISQQVLKAKKKRFLNDRKLQRKFGMKGKRMY